MPTKEGYRRCYRGEMKKIAVLVFAVVAGIGCTSKMDAAYNSCVDTKSAELIKNAEGGSPQLLETVKQDGPKLAEAVCGAIKVVCADDFDGTMCQQTIRALK